MFFHTVHQPCMHADVCDVKLLPCMLAVIARIDLRLMFVQEFVDELVMSRTLKEELQSVFVEEAKIMDELDNFDKVIEHAHPANRLSNQDTGEEERDGASHRFVFQQSLPLF